MNVTKTYMALAGLALGAAGLAPLTPSLVQAAGLFDSQPLDASRFAVLARPVGTADWNLLLLEQLQQQPLCWQPRRDGLVDPALNRFDYTGICNRYLDSNGYSLRVADEDLASRYRLRLQQVGSELQLQAFSPEQPRVLLLGRGDVPLRDRDGFVALRLEPGWELRRRSFGGQGLNHVYFSSAASLEQLIAARRTAEDAATSSGSDAGPLGRRLSQALAPLPNSQSPGTSQDPPLVEPGRTIALQVIPFQN